MPDPTFRGVLLDIEGTTSSISFVFDIMFPYVREHVAEFLVENASDASCLDACQHIARDAGEANIEQCFGGPLTSADVQAAIVAHVNDLMDRDVKATGLKQLQGLIWESGFRSGSMSAHVYPDVVPAMKRWRDAGIRMWIYSSGSVHAQKLFFGHSINGSLLDFFDGHWDTQVGGKKEASSYKSIAEQINASSGLGVGDVLFVSDVIEELDAASSAGMQTRLAIRPGNRPVEEPHEHQRIESFDAIGYGPFT
ncbi:MAG: acireductone synthase [Planctomycetota bacterium]